MQPVFLVSVFLRLTTELGREDASDNKIRVILPVDDLPGSFRIGGTQIEEIHFAYAQRPATPPRRTNGRFPGLPHWVVSDHAVPAEVRLYNRLCRVPEPKDENYTVDLNPDSLAILANYYAEVSLKNAVPETGYQFERLGYFCADLKDSRPGKPVFNRIVPLRDSWTKIAGGGK